HVNPERPWPQVAELARLSAAAGFALHERLTVYPEYVRRGPPWLDPRLAAHVAALAGPDGLANEAATPVGRAWQGPAGGLAERGRPARYASFASPGRSADGRGDFDSV